MAKVMSPQIKMAPNTTPPPVAPPAGSPAPSPVKMPVGTAPAPIQDFGAIPQVGTTYANAATVNPNSIKAEKSATVDPQQNQQYLTEYEAALQGALAPGNAQQQQQLEEQNRARGIQDSGSAGYLSGNLMGQQAAAYSAGIEPLIGQEAQNTQQDIMSNQANKETAYNNQYQGYLNSIFSNQADKQQVNLANAGASNQSSAENAAAYGQAENENFNAYNSYLSSLFGAGTGENNALLEAELGSYGPNSGVGNMYSGMESGANQAYDNVFSSQNAAQAQEIAGGFGAAGSVMAAGASAGA